jgi:hypothetical protein
VTSSLAPGRQGPATYCFRNLHQSAINGIFEV